MSEKETNRQLHERDQRDSIPQRADGAGRDVLETLWRRRRTILLVTVLSVTAAGAYVYRAVPKYTSTSRLYVEQKGPKIITDNEGVMTQSKNYLYTQCELLKSTPILAAAMNRPGMQQMQTFGNVTNPIASLKQGLNVTVGKKNDIISVAFTSPYPKEAANVINNVVDAYVTYHSKQKRSTASEVLKILQKEKIKRDIELRKQLDALVDFKKANGALGLEYNKGNVVIQRLARLSDALTTAELDTINARAACEAVKALADNPTGLRQFGNARRNENATESIRLRAELNRLQLRLTALKGQCTEEHPAAKAVKAQIDQIKAQITSRGREFGEAYAAARDQELERAIRREKEIRRSFEQQCEKAQNLNVQAAEYAVLKTGLRQTERLCEILDSRIKELNVTEDTGALNISVLEVAAPATKPSSPRKARAVALGLASGLLFGIFFALVRDWMDQRLRSAEEIQLALGAPVLGTIPLVDGRHSRKEYGQTVSSKPTSHAAEAYRSVRTAVYFGVPEGRAKTILITSPGVGDGKTSLVSNLAIAMAQTDQRTLILDADFRKPMQQEMFHVEREPGLSSVLAGQEQLDNVIRSTAVENLDVLTCGSIPPNPSEMLNSEKFTAVLEELSARYDRILVDSPPVMPVTDARILAAHCDVTLLVLRADKSLRKPAVQAHNELLNVGAKVLGVVVNAIHRDSGRYGYYGRYGYGAREQKTKTRGADQRKTKAA